MNGEHEKTRTARLTILRTKDELDAIEATKREWMSTLAMLGGYRRGLGSTSLEHWQEMYAAGTIDFERFEAGLTERLQ